LQRTLRTLLALAALLVAAVALVACGGGDGASADSGTDVDTLLDQTFSGSKKIESGKVDLSLKADVSGGSTGVSGPISVKLSGPFESQGAKKLPKFNFDVAASAQGQDIKAGVESTGDKGFVSFNGTDYVLSDRVFEQFKAGYEQAAAKGGKRRHPSLASLGLDPKKRLKDPKNAGEGKVGDTDVIRITGGVDVPKFLDDVNTALAKTGSLGVPNAQLPSRLTARQRQRIEKAVKDVRVEIATGKDDSILRRMKVDLTAQDPSGKDGKATIAFDLKLLDVNESQDFPEPSGAKPFDQLLSQFGVSGLGGLTGQSSSGSGGSSGGASRQQLQDYTDCIEQAGSDQAKAQKGAALLKP